MAVGIVVSLSHIEADFCTRRHRVRNCGRGVCIADMIIGIIGEWLLPASDDSQSLQAVGAAIPAARTP